MKIGSYPKIYNLGHRAIRDLFKEPTVGQEKVDGSQFSFMYDGNELHARSKRQKLHFYNPEKMFKRGMEEVGELGEALTVGWIYRGEYLQKPRHNVLKYDRIPVKHIILYDVQVGMEDYLSQRDLADEAKRLGLEVVPSWDIPAGIKLHDLSEMLQRVSVLGGVPVEGIVIKNYERFDQYTGKVLMGKHVSEAFKEVHRSKKYKTTNKDIIQSLTEQYKTEARWQKAVQVMRETGTCTDSPKDIGDLIRIVNLDVRDECMDEIKEALFKWGWKQISRGITAGLPEWYKEKLLAKQFEED